MHKTLVSKTEIFDLIVNCYQTDETLIKNYHVLSGSSLSNCVDRTVLDIFNNDIVVYKLMIGNKLVGYFGQKNDWLAGFFIVPEFRKKDNKQAFWNVVCEHFNNCFKTAIYSKNIPAKKFLTNNGCKFERFETSEDGLGEIYMYMKGNN